MNHARSGAGRRIAGWARGALALMGAAALVVVLLAFTPLPWMAYDWLGSDPHPLQGAPDYIVLLGGGGIPSETGLMRSYQTALMAEHYTGAVVIVAMPFEAGEDRDHPGAVSRELELRGVAASRLRAEGRGRHTREQALNVRAMIAGGDRAPVVLLVTSPEHMRRALLSFRKAGFSDVHGSSVYSQDLGADLRYASTRGVVPEVGGSLMLRYRLWDNLLVEIRVVRECAALVYYRVQGWI